MAKKDNESKQQIRKITPTEYAMFVESLDRKVTVAEEDGQLVLLEEKYVVNNTTPYPLTEEELVRYLEAAPPAIVRKNNEIRAQQEAERMANKKPVGRQKLTLEGIVNEKCGLTPEQVKDLISKSSALYSKPVDRARLLIAATNLGIFNSVPTSPEFVEKTFGMSIQKTNVAGCVPSVGRNGRITYSHEVTSSRNETKYKAIEDALRADYKALR